MTAPGPATSGIADLDRTLGGLFWGDNVVWEVRRHASVEPFVRALVAAGEQADAFAHVSLGGGDAAYGGHRGHRRLGRRPERAARASCSPPCAPTPGAAERTILVFDPLDAMAERWGAEIARRFFVRCCPMLLEIGAIAYWSIGSADALAALRREVEEVTQCVLVVDDHRVRIAKADGRPPGVEGSVLTVSRGEDGEMRLTATPAAARLAGALRSLRQRRDLSQTDLARLGGVSPSAISHAERGQSGLSLDTLLDLSAHLNVTLDELLRGDAERGYQLARRHDPSERSGSSLLPLLDELGVGLRVFLARLPPRASRRARRAAQGRRGRHRRARASCRSSSGSAAPRCARARRSSPRRAPSRAGATSARARRCSSGSCATRCAPSPSDQHSRLGARASPEMSAALGGLGARRPGPTFMYVLVSLRHRRGARRAPESLQLARSLDSAIVEAWHRQRVPWSATTPLCDAARAQGRARGDGRAQLPRRSPARGRPSRQGLAAALPRPALRRLLLAALLRAEPTICAARPGACASACWPMGDDLARALERRSVRARQAGIAAAAALLAIGAQPASADLGVAAVAAVAAVLAFAVACALAHRQVRERSLAPDAVAAPRQVRTVACSLERLARLAERGATEPRQTRPPRSVIELAPEAAVVRELAALAARASGSSGRPGRGLRPLRLPQLERRAARAGSRAPAARPRARSLRAPQRLRHGVCGGR